MITGSGSLVLFPGSPAAPCIFSETTSSNQETVLIPITGRDRHTQTYRQRQSVSLWKQHLWRRDCFGEQLRGKL